MSDYDNRNSGALFKNKEKAKPDANQAWPDYKGSINVEGVEYWVSSWIKTPRAGGDKFMSMSLKRKESPPPKTSDQAPTTASSGMEEDDIPF